MTTISFLENDINILLKFLVNKTLSDLISIIQLVFAQNSSSPVNVELILEANPFFIWLNSPASQVFAHYDKYNSIQEYVLYYLKELRKVADTIIFVSDSNLPESEISKVQPLVKLVIATPHGEYDFGSYKRGFSHIPDR